MVANDESRNAVISPRRLWFGLAAGAVAWVSLGCIDILITWRTCIDDKPFGAGRPIPLPAHSTLRRR